MRPYVGLNGGVPLGERDKDRFDKLTANGRGKKGREEKEKRESGVRYREPERES
jgi:hypothetical protein